MTYLINTNWDRLQLLQYQLQLTSQQMTCAVTMARLWFQTQKKVQIGKDQEKAQSENDSHSKTARGIEA